MDWFRHYHGMCTNLKLHRAACDAGVKRYMAVAGWCAVLEQASAATPRGNVRCVDDAALAYLIDCTIEEAGRLLSAFRELGMIDADGDVTAWKERQFASDSSTERVRRFREKGGNASGNGPEAFPKRTRTDQTQKQNKPPIVPHSGDAASPFERFWQLYPRKVGKRAAQTGWDKAVKRTDIDAIMRGLAVAIASWRGKDPDFIPHPSTWLNQDRWLDQPPERGSRRSDIGELPM